MSSFLRKYDLVAGDYTTNTFTPDLEAEGHTFNMGCTLSGVCHCQGRDFEISDTQDTVASESAPAQHLPACSHAPNNELSSINTTVK